MHGISVSSVKSGFLYPGVNQSKRGAKKLSSLVLPTSQNKVMNLPQQQVKKPVYRADYGDSCVGSYGSMMPYAVSC